jgi:hypothetical protein
MQTITKTTNEITPALISGSTPTVGDVSSFCRLFFLDAIADAKSI